MADRGAVTSLPPGPEEHRKGRCYRVQRELCSRVHAVGSPHFTPVAETLEGQPLAVL